MILVAVLILAAIAGTVSTTRAHSTQTAEIDQALRDAVDYLVGNYNESTRLIRESPDTGNSTSGGASRGFFSTQYMTYYLYSDNYLASNALRNYSRGEDMYSRMADNISRQMKVYIEDAQNRSVISDYNNHFMVLTKPVPVFRDVNSSKYLTPPDMVNASWIVNYSIMTDIHDRGKPLDPSEYDYYDPNGNGFLDPSHYADVAFLGAIYEWKWGNNGTGDEVKAKMFYDFGVGFWDDGRGFHDWAFSGKYETYKLALYIYATKLLRQGPSKSYDDALATLLAMQQDGTGQFMKGGFSTKYTVDNNTLIATDSTNAETTSLAVLALIGPTMTPEPIPEFDMMPLVVMALMAMVVIAGETRRKRRSWP